MRLVKVRKEFFELCRSSGADPHNQLLQNKDGRPCVLIVRLRYKGKNQSFVVPLKSNITPNTDRKTFFALPPNNKTHEGNFRGIYYIKLFPIKKRYILPYFIDGDQHMTLVQNIIDDYNNESEIIQACQDYLNDYEQGKRHPYTPEIDLILEQLEK